MKVFKKIGLTLGLISSILGGALQSNSALAISDNAIEIHNKTCDLVDLVANYYIKEDPQGLNNFIKKLNKKQLETLKNSFGLWSFPEFAYTEDGLSLSISLRSINLLVAAVKSADLELIKLIVENFDIPDINETDDCGCGSPLWCAVCLADEKNIDNKTAIDIVDYLLSIGTNPYEESGKGYIPCLFEDKQTSGSRMIFKEVFEKHGYGDIFKN